MKTIIGLIIVVLLGIGGYYLFARSQAPAPAPIQNAPVQDTTETVTIQPVEHASAVIKWRGDMLYTDPTGDPARYAPYPGPSIVFLTDIHPDHLSTSTLAAVKGGAMVVAPQAVADLLPDDLKQNMIVMKNGELKEIAGYLVTAVPMYNYPEATSSPHTKGRGNGYVIEKNKFRVYVAGDTGPTPEMKGLRKIDIALIPMNLPYTMSVQDAASAVVSFKPAHVYPYHYRGQDGLSDVNEFKRLVNEGDAGIDVVLLNWYPGMSETSES